MGPTEGAKREREREEYGAVRDNTIGETADLPWHGVDTVTVVTH